MRAFRRVTAPAILLLRDDINTDDIIPAHYLKVTQRAGLAQGLFARWRYREDGTPDPDFPLNRPGAREARFLVTGANFGSGSSREHAVWALMEWGFRAVLAPSFADIFYTNAVKNGLLPVRLAPEAHRDLVRWLEAHPQAPLTVDLEAQHVRRDDGVTYPFTIDAFARHMLLHGLDELDVLLQHQEPIAAFERRQEQEQPFLPRVHPLDDAT